MKKAIKYIILAIVWAVVSVALFFVGRFIISSSCFMELSKIAENETREPEHLPPAVLYHPDKIDENAVLYNPFEIEESFIGHYLHTRESFFDKYRETLDPPTIVNKLAPNENSCLTRVYAFAAKDSTDSHLGFGNWTTVYTISDETSSYLSETFKNSFAVMDIDKAIDDGYWSEIQTAFSRSSLRESYNMSLKLDRYALKGTECVPIDLTFSSPIIGQKTYHPHDSSEFDSSWTICDASDVYVLDPSKMTGGNITFPLFPYNDSKEIINGREELNTLIQNVDWNSTGDEIRITKENTEIKITYQIVSDSTGTYLMALYTSYRYPDVTVPMYFCLLIAWTIAFWAISLVAILIVKAVKKNIDK